MRIINAALPLAVWTLATFTPEVAAAAPQDTRLPDAASKLRRAKEPVRDQYIVVLEEALPGAAQEHIPEVARRLAARHGGRIFQTYEYALHGFAVRMTEAQAQALAAEPEVKYVEEDGVIHGDTTQTSATWGLDRIDQIDLPVDSNYNYNLTGTGVNAYIIDSGVRATHDDFGGRVTNAFTNIDDNGDGTNDFFNACSGHGTHVAGTVGGSTWGVAKGVNLHNVRVLDCTGTGTWAGFVAGVDWVAANFVRPAVANVSISGGTSQAADDSIRNAITAGVTVVVAAGNNGADACNASPARTAEAITVAATDSGDNRASYSNFGSCVDIFAPGTGITSAWSTSNTATNVSNGTSMAAPHVAGAAAIYLQFNPSAAPAAVTNALIGYSTRNKVNNAGTNSPNRLLFSNPSPYSLSPYTIMPSHSVQCLDVTDASTSPGAALIQWHCNGEGNQRFWLVHTNNGYYQIVSHHSGMCLDVDNASTTAGASVIQWPCNGDTNQQFYPYFQGNGFYRFIARHSGLCLDIYDSSTAANARLIQWYCNNDFNQLFKVN